MFDTMAESATPSGDRVGGLPTHVLAAWVDTLVSLCPPVDDAEAVDQIGFLERLKSACAAAQARVTAGFAAGQREEMTRRGMSRAEQARSIGAQVALARRESPARGNQHLGVAEALTHDLPGTLAALTAGEVSEWRATLVVRETACLGREDRRRVDVELAGRLGSLGDRQVAAEARRVAYRLDPVAVMARVRGAESDRRVTLRPAPEAMSRLSGLLPVAAGVAAHTALAPRHAEAARAAGDQRSRGQIMADELVARITGQPGHPATTTSTSAPTSAAADPCSWNTRYPAPPAPAGPAPAGPAPADAACGGPGAVGVPAGVGIDVQLVMTDAALFGADDTAATLLGYGPVPAALARRLVREADEATRVWLRRVYTHPETGALVAMEARGRCFEHGLRQVVIVRDEATCRTPWCTAPARHVDHVVEVHDGGQTTAANAQGLCEACNYVKTTPGWTARPGPDGTITTTTPTGHAYTSPVPRQPGTPPAAPPAASASCNPAA